MKRRRTKLLYSNKSNKKPGRKGPLQEVIDLIIEIKTKNPRIGYGRISMKIYQVFGMDISRFAVGRIIRKHFSDNTSNHDGPSWLTFISHMKDSLWSVDLFRCESITLKSHWVLVVMDQFSRRIIGFAVHAGDCDGAAYCRMFNRIISGKDLPKYLSTDNDPIYLFHRWQANLRVLDIEEIKSVPRTPTSHPFIERVIRTTRNECLDQMLFFNQYDLQNKLNQYQEYYNNTRSHSSLAMNTPKEAAANENVDKKVLPIDNYRWQSYCRELYNFPVAA